MRCRRPPGRKRCWPRNPGIDLAIVELRKSLYPAPNHAWEGWNNTPANGVTSYGLTTIANAGMAGTPMTVEANVDAPASLIDPNNGWQYYRIRTVGTMPITGPARAADNKQDTRLRRLSLHFERFTDGILTQHAITSPQVCRRAEAIVSPVSSFALAIMSVGTIDLTDQNIVIDSYDSSDPNKSTNGLYDAAKQQSNGDIATDGNIIDAGNAHIYGDVSTNSGTVTGAANITGTERTDFYQEPIPVGGAFLVGGQPQYHERDEHRDDHGKSDQRLIRVALSTQQHQPERQTGSDHRRRTRMAARPT